MYIIKKGEKIFGGLEALRHRHKDGTGCGKDILIKSEKESNIERIKEIKEKFIECRKNKNWNKIECQQQSIY